MNTQQQLEQAARVVARLVNLETPVTASLEVVVGRDGIAAPKYRISLGDVCDRGAWKWICVWGDTPDQCVDEASIAAAGQADKKALEIRDLVKRANELGLVVAGQADKKALEIRDLVKRANELGLVAVTAEVAK